MKIDRIIAYCWKCNQPHNITHEENGKVVRCKNCGGYVVSPSGKIQARIEADSNA